MRKFVFVALACCAMATGAARSRAQPAADSAPAGSTPASAADVEALASAGPSAHRHGADPAAAGERSASRDGKK